MDEKQFKDFSLKLAPELAKSLRPEVEKIVNEQVLKNLEAAKAKQPAQPENREDLVAALEGASGQPARRADAKRKKAQRMGALGSLMFVRGLSAPAISGSRSDVETELKRYAGYAGIEGEKALFESIYAQGGSLVPVQQSEEVIEFLRAKPILSQMGVRMVPFDSELRIGRLNAGTTANWSGEGAAATASTLGTGQVVLKAHKLIVLCDVSNDLIRKGRGQEITGEDMVKAAAVAFDLAGLNGTGQNDQPTGILSQILAANQYNNAGTTAANYVADLDTAVQLVRQSNIPPDSSWGWIISPNKERDLKGLVQGTAGYWVFRDEMLQKGTIGGFPYKVSTQMDTHSILFGAFSDVLFGLETNMQLTVHPDQLANQDETRMRLVMRGDFALRHTNTFARILNY